MLELSFKSVTLKLDDQPQNDFQPEKERVAEKLSLQSLSCAPSQPSPRMGEAGQRLEGGGPTWIGYMRVG